MKTIDLRTLLICCAMALTLGACTSKGPDVIDPNSSERNQVALVAVVGQGGSGELVRFSEVKGVVTSSDYASSNGGAQLGRTIDAIYDSYLRDRLYLMHRAEGAITVIDAGTRARLGEITGLPAGPTGLSGLAVSNYSQAWAIASDVKKLYEIDTRNSKLAREIDLPGRPTAIGTDSSGAGGYVLIGMIGDDGRATVGMIRSNSTDFRIEKTIDFPSPVLYIETTNDGGQVIVLTAGAGGGRPQVFFLSSVDLNVLGSVELSSASLEQYVGQYPNFVRMTRDAFLYVAGSEFVHRVDLQNRMADPEDFYFGSFRVIGLDRVSGLLYAWQQGGATVRRITSEGEDLQEFEVPGTVSDIRFISQYQSR